MPPMVEVKHTSTLNMKEMISDLVSKPGRRMLRAILVNQEPIFGFKAKDPIQHEST